MDVASDDCDCICQLEADYLLTDLSAGTWTIRAAFVSTEVTVEQAS